VLYEIPIRRLTLWPGISTGFVGLLLHPIPRSETWRRLMFSRLTDQPLQGTRRSKKTGGRVDLGGKTENRQQLNFTGKRRYSQASERRLWITNSFYYSCLQLFISLLIRVWADR
jgi:hypothetical protein